MKSKIIILVFTSLAVLALAIPVLAGGWAVITVIKMPSEAFAGEPFTVRFAVRQHGRTLMPDLTPTVNIQNIESGESISVDAAAVEGKTGYYEANLTFPTAGTWKWAIQAFTMDQRMPDLTVSMRAPASNVIPEDTKQMPLLAGVAGLLLALAALPISLRSKKGWVFGLVLLGLLVGGVGFAYAAGKEKNTNQPAPAIQPTSAVETGEKLFVTKGCLTCHVNDRIDGKYYDFRSEFGPNLTNYTASPEFLQMWLADPAAVRSNVQMPDLELDETEITSLIAFLNGNPSPGESSSVVEPVIPSAPSSEQLNDVAPTEKPQTGRENACSNIDLSHGLLVSYNHDADSRITLVDPLTGDRLCKADKLVLGSSPTYALMLDRTAMAVLSVIP